MRHIVRTSGKFKVIVVYSTYNVRRERSTDRRRRSARTPALDSDIIDRVHRGEEGALGKLFESHRPLFRRMVEAQLDPRLRRRVDPSDILQEAGLEVHARLADFRADPRLPVLLWMRLVVRDKIVDAHRAHLGAKIRDVRQEVPLGARKAADVEEFTLALVDTGTSPSEAAVRAELIVKTLSALERLDAVDREVVYLRHFESMDSRATAAALGMTEAAVAKRYVRSLAKIRERVEADVGTRP